MLTFFCSDDNRHDFRDTAEEVEANDMAQAAETFGERLFDAGADEARPVLIIVAETRDGRNATRYSITKRTVITIETNALGEVDIPADADA